VRRTVRDDPENPDPGFAELYASLPDATDLEPWLGWCRAASGPVLYLGIGAGRIAAPLARAGVELVGVDAHPAMLERARERLPGVDLVQARIEDLDLGRRFDLVIAPSSVLAGVEGVRAAARHASGRVAYEAMNPHWLLGGDHPGARVVRASHDWAEIEIDYPPPSRGRWPFLPHSLGEVARRAGGGGPERGMGWTQLARARLTWPEEVEDLLAQVGLRLELMRGGEPEADLTDSSSYYVLASAV
jgi:SAM-dependent methyltransferase